MIARLKARKSGVRAAFNPECVLRIPMRTVAYLDNGKGDGKTFWSNDEIKGRYVKRSYGG